MRLPIKSLPGLLKLFSGNPPLFFWSYYSQFYTGALPPNKKIPISMHLLEICKFSAESPGTALMAILLFAISSLVLLFLSILANKKLTRIIILFLSVVCSFLSICYISLQHFELKAVSLGFLLYSAACMMKTIFLLKNIRKIRADQKVSNLEDPYIGCRHRTALSY